MALEVYNVPVLGRIITVICYSSLASLQIFEKRVLTSPHLHIYITTYLHYNICWFVTISRLARPGMTQVK